LANNLLEDGVRRGERDRPLYLNLQHRWSARTIDYVDYHVVE